MAAMLMKGSTLGAHSSDAPPPGATGGPVAGAVGGMTTRRENGAHAEMELREGRSTTKRNRLPNDAVGNILRSAESGPTTTTKRSMAAPPAARASENATEHSPSPGPDHGRGLGGQQSGAGGTRAGVRGVNGSHEGTAPTYGSSSSRTICVYINTYPWRRRGRMSSRPVSWWGNRRRMAVRSQGMLYTR